MPMQAGKPTMSEATKPMPAPVRGVNPVQLLLRYGLVLALVGLGTVLSFLSPVFLTTDNLIQILLQASINLIVALGMTFVIITAGIDLSVGSTAALAGVILANLLKSDIPAWTPAAGGDRIPWVLAVVAAICVGLIIGSVNGLLITRLRITPFIVTLGMLSVVRGLALIYTEGRPIFGLPEAFNRTIGGETRGIPHPVIIAGLLAMISWLVLRYTRLGEYTYAIGGNQEATRLSGVNVDRYIVAIYMICGSFAAMAGVVLTARLRAAEPIAASGYELDAIAATVMGGTSLFGGEGSVIGTILGALLISTLRNGLNLLNVQSYYQQLAIGLVIILAVALDRFRQ